MPEKYSPSGQVEFQVPDAVTPVELVNESDAVVHVLEDPQIGRILDQLPHLDSLMQTYRAYSSVVPLLDKADAEDDEMVRQFLLTDTDQVNELPSMYVHKLMREAVFSHALKTGKTWDNRPAVKTIVRSIQFLFLRATPTRLVDSNQLARIKKFWTGVLVLDDASLRGIQDPVQVARAYGIYVAENRLPDNLLRFFQEYELGKRRGVSFQTKFSNDSYLDMVYKTSWLSPGTEFLENVLAGGKRKKLAVARWKKHLVIKDIPALLRRFRKRAQEINSV